MIQDNEIDAWLGDAALTPDQRAEFGRLVREYAHTVGHWTGDAADYADEDQAAWVAALESVTGQLDVAARGREYRTARDRAYAGAVIAVLAGMSEVQAAREATITRRTLRRAMGKS